MGRIFLMLCLLAGLLLPGCGRRDDGILRIGVAFETLQTEYWVASIEALRTEINGHGMKMIEAVADNDANRQLDQIHTSSRGASTGSSSPPKTPPPSFR